MASPVTKDEVLNDTIPDLDHDEKNYKYIIEYLKGKLFSNSNSTFFLQSFSFINYRNFQ